MTFDELFAFAGRHALLSAGLLGLTVALLYTEVARLLRPYKPLRPAELTALVNREDARVFDLSATADFEKGHIAGSRNVQASAFGPEHRQVAAERERPLVVVCRTGAASAQAAARLSKAGFSKVYWLDGGIAAWQQADLPLVKGRGR